MLIVSTSLAFASGCDSPAATGGAPASDLAIAAPPDLGTPPRQWAISRIDAVGAGGYQTSIAAGGGTVSLATLSSTDKTGTCMTMNGPAEVRAYDVWYAESKAG